MQDTATAMRALAEGEGEAIWFLGNLVTVKATGEETDEAFSLTEHLAPVGFGTPPHRHQLEDEAFFVLGGEISGDCDGQPFGGGPGTYVFLPRGSVHSYKVEGNAPARILILTTPAGFERFCRESGEPAATRELPPPAGEAEIGKMLAAAPRFGVEILPPA